MTERRFNAILDNPPEKIWRGVVDKTDFKQVLKFFRLIDDPELSEPEKFQKMVKIFFTKLPDLPPQEIADAVLEFIAGGKKEDGESGGTGSAKKVFDWNQDAGRILAAFWQAYQIDLRSVTIHWWVFNELFQNLPDEVRLMKVIELRGRKSQKGDSPEAKKALREAQRTVELESDDGGESALDDFFNVMARGR